MNRLTYKLNEQEQEEHKTKYLKFEYFPIPDYCLEKGNSGRITSDMIYNKLGKLEDLEEQLGCPLEVVVKAFKNYVGWTTECDFGYDNIPDEYQKYKDDNRFKTLSYDSGLIYIAIQEALKEDKSK